MNSLTFQSLGQLNLLPTALKKVRVTQTHQSLGKKPLSLYLRTVLWPQAQGRPTSRETAGVWKELLLETSREIMLLRFTLAPSARLAMHWFWSGDVKGRVVEPFQGGCEHILYVYF